MVVTTEYPCTSGLRGGDTDDFTQAANGCFFVCLQLPRDLCVRGRSLPAPESSGTILALTYHQKDTNMLKK